MQRGRDVLSGDAVLKAAAAVVAAALAVVVLLAARRDRAARWLGVFFALIAANQAAELVRALATDPLPAYRIATIAAALDPLALWMFVHVLVRREPSRARVALMGSLAAALALGAGWALPPLTDASGAHVVPVALAAYTVVVYLEATLVAFRRIVDDPLDPRWRSLAMACTLVMAPQVFTLVDHVFYLVAVLPLPGWRIVVEIAVLTLLLSCAPLALPRPWPREARRAFAVGLAFAGTLLAVSKTLDVVSAITGTPDSALDPRWVLPGRASASVKWLVFGALVSAAVFRHRALAASPRSRRNAARALVALGFLVAALLVLIATSAVIGGSPTGFPWAEALILLVAVVLSQAFQRGVDRVASRVYGTEPMERAVPIAGPLRPGALFADRYEILRYLGRGGSGRVFLGRDRVIDRLVALKETPTGVAEARATSRVAVPGVVNVHDVLPRDDGAVLVVEYVEGGTLAARTAAHGPMRGEEGARVALAILDTLAAIHERGLVHGDIKPSNVLLDGGGNPKISDFGAARSLDVTTALAEHAAPAATVGFAAPEILRGERGDARADVFAAGRLLQRAFDLPALASVATRAVSPRPEDRYLDARAMCHDAVRALSANRPEDSVRRR